VFGAVILLTVLFGLQETRPQMVADQARSESPIGAYRAALSNRTILGYLATNGFNFGIMFSWITVAPFLVIEEYGVPELWFGWIFAVLAIAIMVSAQLNRRLVRFHDGDAVMGWGAGIAVIAACALLLTAITGFGGLVGILVPLFFAVFSLGLVSTNAMAGALAVDPARTGSVSALVGTSQFGFAALVSWLSSHVSADPALAMAIVICGCAAGAIVYPAARLLRRPA